jgi:hypothetical protein
VALKQIREYIARQVLPIGDLGLKKLPRDGLYFPDDLPPVLAVLGAQGPLQPRLAASDDRGFLRARPGGPIGPINIIPPRTDLVSVSIPIAGLDAFANAVLMFVVTAASGTTPSMAILPQVQDSQGAWQFEIVAITALTGVGVKYGYFGSLPTQNLHTSNTRLTVSITGTTPSFTWYADLVGF